MNHLRWTKGGSADFVAVDAVHVTVRSSIPSPPGSRLEGELEGGVRVQIKVHDAKRGGDGAFTIRGRLIDVPREVRDRIGALVGFTPAEPSGNPSGS